MNLPSLSTSYKWNHTYLSFGIWLLWLSTSLGILDNSLEFGCPPVLHMDFWCQSQNSLIIFSEAFALPLLKEGIEFSLQRSHFAPFKYNFLLQQLCDGSLGGGFNFCQRPIAEESVVHGATDLPHGCPVSCVSHHGGDPGNPSWCGRAPGLPYPE